MSRRRLVVTVDALVVTGLPGGAPDRIAAQIRETLTAALSGLAAPAGLDGDTLSLPDLTVTLPPGAGAGRVGPAVAQALGRALDGALGGTLGGALDAAAGAGAPALAAPVGDRAPAAPADGTAGSDGAGGAGSGS